LTVEKPQADADCNLVKTTDAQPIALPDRIAGLDVVRGVALFGVMAINIVKEFRVSIFQQFLVDRVDGPWYDRALHAILSFGVDMKALALFSMLFGVGLAIQFDHLSGNPRRTALLIRRLFILLLIGTAHMLLVWNGDILVEYAIAGFVVLAVLYGPRARCGFVGVSLLAFYLVVPSLVPLPGPAWIAQAVSDANRIYATGTFAEVLAFRLRELPGLLPLHASVFPRTVGLMLIGAWLWRVRALRPGTPVGRMLPYVALLGVHSGGCMLLAHASGAMHGSWQVLLAFERLGTLLLAFGYGAAILWVVGQSRWRSWFMWAQPIGRMAFTNYLAQSVIFGFVFYGYGFGLFGQLGVTTALVIGTAVYLFQVMVSRAWLRRFLFGPVEWLWRSAMYGRRQPFKRSAL
jgi:uncharacterized protein